jgi:hypothetical protein
MRTMADLPRFLRLLLAAGTLPAIGNFVVADTRNTALPPADLYFQIQVVDEQTGRGVPLVELETVNHLRYVTDSAGRVAFHEPGLMEQPVYFFVRSHGYTHPKDGFGNAGLTLTPVAGQRAVVNLTRQNIAERLYRLTGEGIYRDSVLLGEPTPLAAPLGAGKVAGQDSAFAVVYRGQIHWFWGDTSKMSYPLGHFWMAAAVSALPGRGGLDPDQGVDFSYLTDADGFSRPVCRLGVQHGLIWADGFLTIPDSSGRERLICHYAHMESLEKMIGHGLAIYDDASQQFERVTPLDLEDLWRFPAQAHPVRHTEDGVAHFHLGEVFPNVRVRAELEAVLDPTRYEAWTCLEPGDDSAEPRLRRDAHGSLSYAWRSDVRPMDPATEQKLLSAGRLRPDEARYMPVDVESGERIRLHRGSVNWNAYRKRWVLIATQLGGTSALGEVWYSEAADLTGPWLRARKIVTHERYSFYNPVHHASFDQAEGRLIYFEGTYVNTFSGNPATTPRYDYNQIMYRLDLSHPLLSSAQK